MDLTPVSQFDGWCAKREDMPCWVSLDHPSGSKVRQYLAMAKASPGAPMIVGCASVSCMQVYVASAAELTGVPGIIFVPQRKQYSAATWYAIKHGADLRPVKPAYMNVLRARAREHAKELGKVVRWNPQLALKDTMEQCANIPPWVKRVIVPTGSGLTAAGVLAGLALRRRRPAVVALAVSSLANAASIMKLASGLVKKPTGGLFNHYLPNFIFKGPTSPYDDYRTGALPDGTPLDPYYAAKALHLVQKGDCLWLPGLRPVSAMPSEIRRFYHYWKGFK